MQNKMSLFKISLGLLILASFVFPQLSYADWSIGIGIGDHRDRGYRHDEHFYRWHEHPHYGLHMHFLPEGYMTIWAEGQRYYYYDGLYYTYVRGDYILVNPPIGAYVQVIPSDFQPVSINGVTYYTDNGIYYVLTRHHGYKVVAAPAIYVQPAPVVVTQPVTTVVTTPATVPVNPQDTFSVNVPNNSGGYSTVVIKKSGNGYVGPQGEFYSEFPKVSQLKLMYSK